MDNAMTITSGLTGVGSFLALLFHGLFVAAQPTLNLAVPIGIGYLCHRYLRNQTAANALADVAGSAYLNLGTAYATAGSISFATAKQIAITAAVAGMDTASKAAVAHLTTPQITSSVAGKLGQLLASDTTFAVTDPLGKTAAATAMAVAAASIASPAVAVAVAPDAVSVAPSPSPATQGAPTAPNFDVEAFVREAHRGIEAAIHGPTQ